MAVEPAVKVENLTKIYKLYKKPSDRVREVINPFGRKYHTDFYALNDISFEIEKGQTIGIIGKNGSGKSTLLKILTGVLTPASGSVRVNGKISSLLELGAGFNTQMTGLENIYLNGTIMGYIREEMDRRLDDIISFADIGEFVNQPVKMYSSGMFVRLAFAVAVNVDPDVLIVDEALAVGDTRFQLKCIDKMKNFKKRGKTILFVSHDTYSIKNFCDRAMWMMDGRIKILGEVNKVVDLYNDYMKEGSENNEAPDVPEVAKKDILTIDDVKFVDEKGENRNSFKFGRPVKVLVDYTLHKPMEGIVGGVALYDKQHVYVCGLNTKLDHVPLPSSPGKYTLAISYPKPNLLQGTYFVDVAFFESSGIVPLDYKGKFKTFFIEPDGYSAEGLVNIDHSWELC